MEFASPSVAPSDPTRPCSSARKFWKPCPAIFSGGWLRALSIKRCYHGASMNSQNLLPCGQKAWFQIINNKTLVRDRLFHGANIASADDAARLVKFLGAIYCYSATGAGVVHIAEDHVRTFVPS